MVLMQGSGPLGLTEEDVMELAEEVVDDFSIYPTDATVKDSPPQFQIILSDSSASVSTLNTIEEEIRRRSGMGMLGDVQTVRVVSTALSPGDKVRNAMGV